MGHKRHPIAFTMKGKFQHAKVKETPKTNFLVKEYLRVKDSTHHPMVISLGEKKDFISTINPLRWKETKLGNKTLRIPVGRPTHRWELRL